MSHGHGDQVFIPGHTAGRWQTMTSAYHGVLGSAITLQKPTALEPGLGVQSISSACECVLRNLPHIFNNWYEQAIHCWLACCPL